METIAELQARQQTLEQKIAELKGKTDKESQLEARAAKAEIAEIQAKIQLAQQADQLKASAELEASRKEQDANNAVKELINRGDIAIRETELQAQWKQKFIDDPKLIGLVLKGMSTGSPMVARDNAGSGGLLIGGGHGLPASGLAAGRVTPSAAQVDNKARRRTGGLEISGGYSFSGAMRKYYDLVCANAKVRSGGVDRLERFQLKAQYAQEAAAVFKADLEPNHRGWDFLTSHQIGKAIGLEAADFTDPAGNLGTLSGTLVLQRTLPFFAFKYPELLNFYTDFSDTPGLLNQTEMTRIVVQPAVQKYNTNVDAAGRTIGWSTVSPAVTTDVPLTLTDYISVPINFGNNQLAETMRRLFDEQAVLAVKAIAGYFTGLVTNLMSGQIAAGYQKYAAVNNMQGAPIGNTYVVNQQNFNMASLDDLAQAFSVNKVPEEDRGIMLTPTYYARLRNDPRLEFVYAAANKSIDGASDFTTEFRLPKLSGFAPYNAPYLPASAPSVNPTQQNIVGFAFQKAGVIVKARLPQDFSQALGVMVPGSITTVTDPDTKISMMLVQYVNLQTNDAEWRPEVMLGTAVGDARAGLVLTSQ